MGKKSAHARKHERERLKSIKAAALFHGQYVRCKEGVPVYLNGKHHDSLYVGQICACEAITRSGWGRLLLSVYDGYGGGHLVTWVVDFDKVEPVIESDLVMARLNKTQEFFAPLSDKLPKNKKLREKILYKRRLL